MMILIKEFTQLTNHSFRILWSDDKFSVLKLSALQSNCPCARCINSRAGSKEKLRAVKISSVGNYALRIDFTEGCSRGVYTFNFLRTLHLEGS
jgi:DUF971 family protein